MLTLKIGRYEYEITEKDTFMDNGACVQILSQKKQFKDWHYVTPVLSKKAIKQISKYERIPVESSYNAEVFRLKLEENSREISSD